MTTTRPHIVVVGAGLAGLAAALTCVDSGAQVTMFESRPRFGGATWSFQRNGLSFDNGQHVYLKCCTAYREFLARIGSADKAPLRRLAIPVLSPGRNGGEPIVSWIRRSGLPAPLHLARSLATYRHLSPVERLKIGGAALALRRLSLDDCHLDDETFGAFLSRHGQSTRAIAALWDLIALPTINVRADEASLALAAKVFKTGLLGEADAADIGWADVPLTELHVDPSIAILERAGATVRGRAKVDALDVADASVPVVVSDRGHRTAARLSGVHVDGEHVECDAVVLAVSHEAAADLLPAAAGVDTQALRGLGSSPIIDVHVVYDRKVVDFDVAAGIGTPVQFVFDRSTAAGLEPGAGQCIAVSVSGADDEHGLRPEVLIDRYSDALGALFPRARKAKVLDAVVSREHHATFRGLPGTASMRPVVDTAFRNLFLAGAYTATGWPATMEGAVRSGVLAAEHAINSARDSAATASPRPEAVR